MDLWILNKNFEQIGVLDDYKSLIWAKRYNSLGDCEVYIGANDRTFELLQEGNYIIKADDDDMVCRIETVELDTDTEQGDYLIVTGVDCRKILNQRVIWNQTNYKGTAENFIRKIITENVTNPSLSRRKISNFKLGTAKGFTEQVDVQSTFDYLFDRIQAISDSYGYGSKVSFDGTDFTFDLYKGTDRSIDQTDRDVVIFSPDFENLISTKYRTDSSAIKTSALVAGAGEGVERVTKEITGGTGLDRFELFVDAKDVSPEISFEDLQAQYPNGQIVEESEIVYYKVGNSKVAILDHIDHPTKGTLLGTYYEVLLTQKGTEALANTKKTITFDGEVEPNYSYKYGVDYFLGDIVTIRNEYGIEANARVTEVIENDSDSGYSLIPTFQYMEVEEQPLMALLTENNRPILTENAQVLEVEGNLMRVTSLGSSQSVDGVKISELPESTDIYEGCCLPIVTEGETKKLTYALLTEKLNEDLEFLQNDDVVDNLTSTATTKPLSAKQGKVLNDNKVNTSDIVDNLTTNVANKPLSAKQGKVLNDNLCQSKVNLGNNTTMYRLGNLRVIQSQGLPCNITSLGLSSNDLPKGALANGMGILATWYSCRMYIQTNGVVGFQKIKNGSYEAVTSANEQFFGSVIYSVSPTA